MNSRSPSSTVKTVRHALLDGAGSAILSVMIAAFLASATVLLGLYAVGGMTGWACAAGIAALAVIAIVAGLVQMRRRRGGQHQAYGRSSAHWNIDFCAGLVGALTDPALFVDQDGRILCASDAARRHFRFLGERPILSSVLRKPDILDAVDAARDTGQSQTFGFVQLDDLDRHFACVATPITMPDGTGVLITMRDLTEVKQAERARADFLANASHELRTPLTSLAGFIETMRGPARDDAEAWDRFLEIMHGQAERMRRLINDLLSLSRIELNEHRRPDTETDLAAVVTEAVDSLSLVAAEKGVSLKLSGADAPVLVMGVRDELAQVAQNLIDNAIKYSEADQVVEIVVGGDLPRDAAARLAGRCMNDASRMTIAASPSSSGRGFAALRVADEGPGIDRKYLPRLSERFYRVDPGRGLRRGTGLGLAIVKHIVTRHRGDFLVESLLGKGSAFGVVLPMTGAVLDAPSIDPIKDGDVIQTSPDSAAPVKNELHDV